MVPPVLGQLGEKRVKKKKKKNGAHQHFCPWRKFHLLPAPSVRVLKLVNESPSHMTQAHFKLLSLH